MTRSLNIQGHEHIPRTALSIDESIVFGVNLEGHFNREVLKLTPAVRAWTHQVKLQLYNGLSKVIMV
jgi:hypothetical protein